MAKRFTDTEKWKRPWFANLSNIAKLSWFYILDDCDHRGVWIANFRRLSFDMGEEITPDRLFDWFGDKLRAFDDDKYFIPSFVDYQYKKLNPSNKAHHAVIELMERFDTMKFKPLASPLLAPCERLQGPMKGLHEGAQDKDKVKDKDKDKEKDRAAPILRGLWNATDPSEWAARMAAQPAW